MYKPHPGSDLRAAATSPQSVDKLCVAFPVSPIFHTVKKPGRETEGNPSIVL